MYQILRPPQQRDVPVRTLSLRVYSWGTPPGDAPPVVLLHGWMDVAASWQFVMDALPEGFLANRHIIAPDLRGFGRSMVPHACDHYTFHDYLGDVDALLRSLLPVKQMVDLVGHSMGGNIVMLYAAARPERVRRVINLEGFGLPRTQPEQAPARVARWLDELGRFHDGQLGLRTYGSLEEVAARLRKTNPRLCADRALWLAQHWSEPDGAGHWRLLGDGAHKIINPQLFRLEEVLACYRAITAPVLAVHASDDTVPQLWPGSDFSLAEFHSRLRHVPDHRIHCVKDAGHMLHHDQPRAVAALMEQFLAPDGPIA